MKDFSTSLDMRRCKNWAYEIVSWKYLSENLFCHFFFVGFLQIIECLIYDLHPKFLPGDTEGQQLQQLMI